MVVFENLICFYRKNLHNAELSKERWELKKEIEECWKLEFAHLSSSIPLPAVLH